MLRRQFLFSASALAMGCASAPNARRQPSGVRLPSSPRPIVVVGAGLSGLCLAHELTKRGENVLVLEATSRPGGRIRTIRGFRDGHHLDVGAIHVVGDPALMALIEELGVAQSSAPRSKLAHIDLRRGERRVLAAGEDAPGEDNELSAEERAIGEDGRREHYLGMVKRIDGRELTWGPKAFELDALTATEWLQGLGASAGYVGSLEGMFPLGDGLRSISALSLLRELAAMRNDMALPRVPGRIAGGTDRLPQALARRLECKIRYDSVLRGIERRADGATLMVSDGQGTHRIEASRVVLTMPFSVLREIAVSPQWSPEKLRAVRELDSTSVTRAWLETEEQPWRERGEAGTADTDLIVGRVRDELDGAQGRAGLLGIYLSGAPAREIGALDASARDRLLEESFGLVHPGLRALEGGAVVWDREPFARGAYAYFKPGQLTQLAPAAAAPEGVVHFAGCGTSWRPGFMHGAIDSARRVLRELGFSALG